MRALWVAIVIGLAIGGAAYWKSDLVNSTWDTVVTKVTNGPGSPVKAEESPAAVASPATTQEVIPDADVPLTEVKPATANAPEPSAPGPNEETDNVGKTPVPAEVPTDPDAKK